MKICKISAMLVIISLLFISAASFAAPSYLTADMQKTVQLTSADYSALILTAYYNNTSRITDKIIKQSLWCLLGEEYIEVIVDTKVTGNWAVYENKANFSVADREVRLAYQAAGDYILELVLDQFPGVSFMNIRITFTIEGYLIGVYQNGIFTIIRN